MSTDTPRTTERLHLLENEHDDVAFESLADFAFQLERELTAERTVHEETKQRAEQIVFNAKTAAMQVDKLCADVRIERDSLRSRVDTHTMTDQETIDQLRARVEELEKAHKELSYELGHCLTCDCLRARVAELERDKQQAETTYCERIEHLRARVTELEGERDAYKKACESANRDANEWQGKWELNQTDKINLRSALAQAEKDRKMLLEVSKDLLLHISPTVLDHQQMERHNEGVRGMPQGPCRCVTCTRYQMHNDMVRAIGAAIAAKKGETQ